MSKPANPLAGVRNHEPRHILIAFNNTDAACRFQLPPESIGEVGSDIPSKYLNCGKAIVLVNELKGLSYYIKELTWSFDFFSPVTPSTTISAGNFVVGDSRGNQFPSFLRRSAKALGLPETRLTYYLITIFRGRRDGEVTTDYVTSPLIFKVTDVSTGFQNGLNNQFIFNFMFLHNTVAQLPNHSRLDQFTITNSENSPNNTTLSADSSEPKIIPRAMEDSKNTPLRESRIKKSAPMRTLKDVFNGFEAELQSMKFENKRQLQEFISMIRPDAVKKIKTPKAKNVESGDGLPVSFEVNLDEIYHNYPVDNLNLATEQTEIKQLSTGISSITLNPNSSIYTAIEELMKLSKNTGIDVTKGYGFKTSISTIVDCEGVTKHVINVKRYKIPKNKNGADTAPDPIGTKEILELSYLDGDNEYFDIISIVLASSPAAELSILEEDSEDIKDDPLNLSSQREQMSFERPKNTGFSGLRIGTSPVNYGLQSAADGTLVDTLKHRYTLAQNTLTIVEILGNPDLYSDLARNPLQVAESKAGNSKLYNFPEYYPMYAKLTIKLANSFPHGARGPDEDYWYHTAHYHISGVTNIIMGGRFVQTLRLLSSDDAI